MIPHPYLFLLMLPVYIIIIMSMLIVGIVFSVILFPILYISNLIECKNAKKAFSTTIKKC